MPTPSSGQISLSDIASIVYNSSTSEISLGNSEVRIFANDTVDDISLSSAYNKPIAGNTSTTYYTPGNYSFIVPAYKTLTVTLAGGGGGGGSYCGGQVFIGCVNYCCSSNGNPGANSSFNGVFAYGGGFGVSGYGGGGQSGAAGGNSLNANTGGGGAGGAGNTNPTDTNCNQGAGGNGGAGGFAQTSWTKAVTSGNPNYGSTINFTTGAGGSNNVVTSCRDQRGGPGSNGYVYINWTG